MMERTLARFNTTSTASMQTNISAALTSKERVAYTQTATITPKTVAYIWSETKKN